MKYVSCSFPLSNLVSSCFFNDIQQNLDRPPSTARVCETLLAASQESHLPAGEASCVSHFGGWACARAAGSAGAQQQDPLGRTSRTSRTLRTRAPGAPGTAGTAGAGRLVGSQLVQRRTAGSLAGVLQRKQRGAQGQGKPRFRPTPGCRLRATRGGKKFLFWKGWERTSRRASRRASRRERVMAVPAA